MEAVKRFYKTVTVSDDFGILLDGRALKTPAKAALKLPTRALADALANEWRGQGDEVDLNKMPLNRLANTAIDRVSSHREAIVTELAGYGGSDLLSYRADDPALAARQAAQWNPLVEWAGETLGARLSVTTGVTHVKQNAEALAALHRAVAALDDWTLAAMQTLTTISGSIVLALAVAKGRLTPGQAFATSRLDETYQAEKWGEDYEAKQRADALTAEIETAGKFMALARA
ncbi:MAG: ATPase [Alphaproteobacteria bacterium]|nr:ATPase [Alphaproteobacteria bacterium]